MRIARRCGWFDVDAMLASADAGRLDEWIEFERLEPEGDDWERASLIATTMHNFAERVLTMLNADYKADILDWDAFVKYRNKIGEKRAREQRGALRALRSMEGI